MKAIDLPQQSQLLSEKVQQLNQFDLIQTITPILSTLTKQYYKKQTTTKKDLENITIILDRISDAVPKIYEITKISNITEIASYFNYKNKAFWNNIQAQIIGANNIPLNECGQLLRAGAHLSQQIAFSKEVLDILTQFLYKDLEQLEKHEHHSIFDVKNIFKCLYGCDKLDILNHQLIAKYEKILLSSYEKQSLRNIIQAVTVFIKNQYQSVYLQKVAEDFSQDNFVEIFSDNLKECSLLINQYRQLIQVRSLTKDELKVCKNIETAFFQCLKSFKNNFNSYDISLFIQSIGILDLGNTETWKKLEGFAIEKFGELNKLDFDNVLTGFMSTTKYECSLQLQQAFEECVRQNYKHLPEEFIFAANQIGKQPGRGNKIFWDTCLQQMMDYISKEKSNPSIMTMYLKLVSQYRPKDVSSDQIEKISQYILINQDGFNIKDLSSLILSVCTIENFKAGQFKELFSTLLSQLDQVKTEGLFNIIVAQVSQKQHVFTQSEQNQIMKAFEQRINQPQKSDVNLKVVQAIVLYFSIYGLGQESLWISLMKLYQDTFFEQKQFTQYHITSFLGFMIKKSYKSSKESPQFLKDLTNFVNKYQSILSQENMKISMEKFEQIPKLFADTTKRRQNFETLEQINFQEYQSQLVC